MNVFVSWSGPTDQKLAEALIGWMRLMIQQATFYFSPESVEKGAKWSSEVSRHLQASNFGIICMTRGQTTAPWIMFEAGALSKGSDNSRIIPLLFDMNISEVTGPLAHFQSVVFNKSNVQEIVRQLHATLSDSHLKERDMERLFERIWPDLEKSVDDILKESNNRASKAKKRPEKEILSEILETSRSINYQLFQESKHNAHRPFQSGEQLALIPLDALSLPLPLKTKLLNAGITTLLNLVTMSDDDLLNNLKIASDELSAIKILLRKFGLGLGYLV